MTHRIGNREATFDGEPSLPFLLTGQAHYKGWDIPTLWAIDGLKQCWVNDGHGGDLQRVPRSCLLVELNDDTRDKVLAAFGLKPKMPDWMSKARAQGWSPPDGFDPSQWDET